MRRVLPFVVGLATLLGSPVLTRADDASAPSVVSQADAARRLKGVAQIGDRIITVGELEDRLAALPPYQRATFGADAATAARQFLLQVLVPEGLFAQAAIAQKLDTTLPTAFEVERALSNGTLRAIRAGVGRAIDIPQADVQAYYDANRDRYDTPERIQIWRILCKTEDEARQVIDQAKKDLDTKAFGDLARDHSIDKATYLRAGNLGFLGPDGTSSEPGLRLDPAVVRAVQAVKDGQLVTTPVKEGDAWAVAWRRGTIPANKRPIDDVAAQIRDILWKTRVKEATDKMVADLRAAKLRDLNEGALGDLPASLLPEAGASPLGRERPPN